MGQRLRFRVPPPFNVDYILEPAVCIIINSPESSPTPTIQRLIVYPCVLIYPSTST